MTAGAPTAVQLAEHRFFSDLRLEHLQALVGCATVRSYEPGEFLFRHGDPAANFFLVTRGRVAIEVSSPARGPVTLQTVGPHDVLGWTWIVPPYVHRFDARAVEATEAFDLNGDCLRGTLGTDHEFAYQLLSRFVVVVADRLEAARMQLLDLYGDARAG